MNTTYGYFTSVSVEDLRPKAATKIALSEILASRIRKLSKDKRRELAAEGNDR